MEPLFIYALLADRATNNDPKDWRDAMSRPDRDKWLLAAKSEYESLVMSLPPATSRAALPFMQRLLGDENFDEWFFQHTSVILAGEDLTEMATHCAQVETATSMKGLRRAYKVLLNMIASASGCTKPKRQHCQPAYRHSHHWVRSSPSGLLRDRLFRSTEKAIVKSIRKRVDELIKLEKTAIARSCALIYASLSPTVQRDALLGFATNFKPHVSLDVDLQAWDKMRTVVEKLEGRPLSDSHLASALLAALPECIAPDLFVWCGAQPSIPYTNMRQLLEHHWPSLVTKYPHYLGPALIAAAAPVHGSAAATATTRSSALTLPAFHDGASQRDGYGQAAAIPWGTEGQDPMTDWYGYCLSSDSHSTYTRTKLSRAFHQNAARQDFVCPPGWAAIPSGE
ncbi:hypothetical protein DYB28_001095 [Aphanomyces astaci]|uniref:Uncharacterized protein n=1 Tax=Aphanomyces astaci TaxID=112090 RepID=A0A9X8E512_APHAT|nr:hypothetical protein DYB28_001095 [Aphanomyces astaci]